MNANVSEIDACLSDIFEYLTQAIDGLENEQGCKLLYSAETLKLLVDILNTKLEKSYEIYGFLEATASAKYMQRHLSSDFFKEAEHVS